MQALFAPKKNCPNICRREAKFLPPAFFYLRELRRTPIGFKRQKKSREIRQLKIFWNFKEI